MDRNRVLANLVVFRDLVAPHPGAWIETSVYGPLRVREGLSPPTRGRGSKRSSTLLRKLNAGGRPPPGGVDRNHAAGAQKTRNRSRPPPGGVDRNSAGYEAGEKDAWSPPTRGRGSKQTANHRCTLGCQVAPHPGAWIETALYATSWIARQSPPTRGRGSKPYENNPCIPSPPSPPTRGRGSKPDRHHQDVTPMRSPPTRGRGSKPVSPAMAAQPVGRPPPGGVDRNTPITSARSAVTVAPHPGAWIETSPRQSYGQGSGRRPPPGGVDRNPCAQDAARYPRAVAPHPGAWIETRHATSSKPTISSPPTRGRGSKRSQVHKSISARMSPPTRGRGSKQKHPGISIPDAVVAPHPGAWIETNLGAA